MFAETQFESFRPPFSKGGAVKGAEPLSPLASGEIPLSSVKGRRGDLSKTRSDLLKRRTHPLGGVLLY